MEESEMTTNNNEMIDDITIALQKRKVYKYPKINSMDSYPWSVSEYIFGTILNDPSYNIPWEECEIIFKKYGFWRGLWKCLFVSQNIRGLICLR